MEQICLLLGMLQGLMKRICKFHNFRALKLLPKLPVISKVKKDFYHLSESFNKKT